MAVQVVARDQAHHPVRERLNALKWDGTPRLDSWMFTCLGAAARADDGEKLETVEARQRYLQEVGRRWLISAVARIYQPGCKADHALILEGPQGAFKSTAAATLALEPAWFADEIADLGSKDSAQDLRGKWIIELGELSAMKRSEVERVKAFMSRRVDHYRPPYGVRSQDFPRQCTFIGTTNADAYLADETGGRRFWPVKVGRIDIEALQRDREQLWAEAVAAYRNGERWWLEADVEKAAREEQEERRISDPWESVILSWIADKPKASVAEVLQHAIGMATERQDQRARNRVAAVLTGAGWKATRRRIDGSLARFYERPETQTRNSESAAAGAADPPAEASDPEQSPVVPGVDTDTRNEKASNHAGVPGSSRMHTHARARPVVSENRGNTRNTRNSEPIGKCRTCVFTAPLNADGQCGACAHRKPQPRPSGRANMQVTP
jgi:predicted P-loop ATPase